MNKKIVALLPMKFNSERVKGKNFKYFNGKPLFKWILDTLLSIKEIEQVVINTDARNILYENGLIESDRVVIRDRLPEMCGDLVSMNKIIEDDIKNIQSDIFIMSHVTNPLLSLTTIKKALNKFQGELMQGNADSLFTVNNIQTRFYRKDCSPVNHNANKLCRTQDLETWYEENSNLYIFTQDSFMLKKDRIGQLPIMFETSKIESIDIDTQEDWDLALIASKYLSEKV